MKYSKYILSLICCVVIGGGISYCNAQSLDSLETILSKKKVQPTETHSRTAQTNNHNQTQIKVQPTKQHNRSTFKDFIDDFSESPEENYSLYIWGKPTYSFGGSLLLKATDYVYVGVGFESNIFHNDEKLDKITSLYLQGAFSMRYFSVGTLVGFGGNEKKQLSETIHGLNVITQEQESKFHLLASPYIEARIPISEVSLCLAVGYNFYLINGNTHNSLRLGIGLSF